MYPNLNPPLDGGLHQQATALQIVTLSLPSEGGLVAG